MARLVEITCTACGADTLIKREPIYEGFKKIGEKFLCVSCGYQYASESEIPFKEKKKIEVFGDDDRSRAIDIFDDDEKKRNCRYCRHYLVNPFTQRCGLHEKEIQATDICFDFEPATK